MSTDTPQTFIPHPPEWIPHQRETWPTRYATLLQPVEMKYFTGVHAANGPVMKSRHVAAGTTVKIVMVSRLGDVGITERLDAEKDYGARVGMESLTNLRSEP